MTLGGEAVWVAVSNSLLVGFVCGVLAHVVLDGIVMALYRRWRKRKWGW